MKISAIFQVSASLFFIGFILWFGQPFFVPLAFAFLIALVLYPICKFFESKGLGKALSIALPLILLVILFGGIIALLSYELVILTGKWPMIQQQLDAFLQNIQIQLENEFGWTAEKQMIWVKQNLNALTQNAGIYLTNTASTVFKGLFNLIIVPIYVTLILLFRGRLVQFLVDVVPGKAHAIMPLVINDTVKVFSKFIRGMVMVYIIVGLLNSFGLWILGVEHPLIYGMISAIMTIIPYFGIVISALLPMTLTWIETESLFQPIGIVIVFAVVQYLEANLIFPYVVGRFVNLNTLVSIAAILLGALIWGVSGMILFIPLFAVFKIFASHFPELQPWSKLLGNSKQ